MTAPDTLAAAREAVAFDVNLKEAERAEDLEGSSASGTRRMVELIAGEHARDHYAAIAAALLEAEAEIQRLRGEMETEHLDGQETMLEALELERDIRRAERGQAQDGR